MPDLKRTPLYDYYQEQKVKLVDFGGWAMPMQFSSIIKEHTAVRERVGLFDCSHMGEIYVSGPDAEAYLNNLLTNNVSRMEDGGVQYNIFCRPDGGAIDDVMLYRHRPDTFTVVSNASNTEQVWEWMNEHLSGDVIIENHSTQIGLIAVQGPFAEAIIQELTDVDVSSIARHTFLENITIAGVEGNLISRTGYTGEDGFEIYVPAEGTRSLWESLLAAAQEKDGLACGLGARDTLRLEAGLPLFGQELTAAISPIMAGVGFAVKTKKAADFIGKDVLRKQREEGTNQKVVAFRLSERGIPRTDYLVFDANEKEIGKVTSGTQSPTLKQGIGMALVDVDQTAIGTKLYIEIRNKLVPAEIVKKPFI